MNSAPRSAGVCMAIERIPMPPRGANDPAGDLAAIGDEDVGEHVEAPRRPSVLSERDIPIGEPRGRASRDPRARVPRPLRVAAAVRGFDIVNAKPSPRRRTDRISLVSLTDSTFKATLGAAHAVVDARA